MYKRQIKDQVNGNGASTGEKIVTSDHPSPQKCTLGKGVRAAVQRYNMAVLALARESELTDLDGNYGRLHEKGLRVAALMASLENEGIIELRHWARAQEIVERWRLYAHRLYEQVTELDVSPQAEIEAKVVKAVTRWQGTDRYPDGLSAADIARFLRGLGTGEARFHAEQLVAAGVLASHKKERALRYYVPGADEGES